jgi:hypothetical protein
MSKGQRPVPIQTFEEAMDTILRMVKATEHDDEMAIAAAATIGRLIKIGRNDLALDLLATYKPEGA